MIQSLNLGQIHLGICTNTFSKLEEYILSQSKRREDRRTRQLVHGKRGSSQAGRQGAPTVTTWEPPACNGGQPPTHLLMLQQGMSCLQRLICFLTFRDALQLHIFGGITTTMTKICTHGLSLYTCSPHFDCLNVLPRSR